MTSTMITQSATLDYNPEGLDLCEYAEEMPRNLAFEAAVQAMEDRILGRERPTVVTMEIDDACDRCGQTILAGTVAAYFPRHERLACAACAGLTRTEREELVA